MSLVKGVQEWAEERGIYEGSTALTQKLFMIGELCNEVRDAIAKDLGDEAIKTEIGDVYVFAINWLTMCKIDARTIEADIFPKNGERQNDISNPSVDDCVDGFVQWINVNYNLSFRYLYTLTIILGYDREECLKLAYDKITKRKTTMQNGKAVK